MLVPGVVGGVCETEGAGEAGAADETEGVVTETVAEVGVALGVATDVPAAVTRFGTGGFPPFGAPGIAAAGV